jgi:uncharacterized protein with HEPN domain
LNQLLLSWKRLLLTNNSDFTSFESNFISIRAVERDLMIIGEAIGKILKIKNEVTITSSKHIIGLRNLIVHSYDSIEPAALWRILIIDLPTLKNEIHALKNL